MQIRGPWAAVAPNRDAARRIGTGHLTTADLGEDQSLAADIPRLVEHALQLAPSYPWRDILEMLGVRVDDVIIKANPETGAPHRHMKGDKRIHRIRTTWKTRTDRYSEERAGLLQVQREEGKPSPKRIEMYQIGG